MTSKLTYLRRADGVFAKRAPLNEVAVAPGGARVVGIPTLYTTGGRDSVVVIDGKTGKTGKTINTVKEPLTASYPYWHRGGRQVVLTVEKKVAKKWNTIGFTIVDTVAGTARSVTVPGVDKTATFHWAPDGRQLVASHGDGARFYGIDGKVRRNLTQSGTPTGGEDIFSPSGNRLSAWCPARFREHVCLVDRVSGKVVSRVPIKPETMWGWWDDTHLIAVLPTKNAFRVAVVTTTGKVARVLADIPAADWKKDPYLAYNRR
ncbi:hypothetical protein [Streptosporangium sp. KLBMP 9127]|nr:hypothetical protein [Streptosporangium sp. KLBMP 9127]